MTRFAVVLSHLHGDHWDRVSQQGLDRGLPIVTTPHTAERLHHRGFGHALGLSRWQRHTITKGGNAVHLTSLPGRHARLWNHRLLPPVMGTLLEFVAADRSVRRLYVSGDTLLVEELDEIRCVSARSTSACCTWAGRGCRPAGGFRSG